MKQIYLKELRSHIYIDFINICLIYDKTNITLMFLIITEIRCFSPGQKRHDGDCVGDQSLLSPPSLCCSHTEPVMTGDVWWWQDEVWLMIRVDHEISNEEERDITISSSQWEWERTFLASCLRLPLSGGGSDVWNWWGGGTRGKYPVRTLFI